MTCDREPSARRGRCARSRPAHHDQNVVPGEGIHTLLYVVVQELYRKAFPPEISLSIRVRDINLSDATRCQVNVQNPVVHSRNVFHESPSGSSSCLFSGGMVSPAILNFTSTQSSSFFFSMALITISYMMSLYSDIRWGRPTRSH